MRLPKIGVVRSIGFALQYPCQCALSESLILATGLGSCLYTRMAVSILLAFFTFTLSLFKTSDKDVFVLPQIDNLLLKIQNKWKSPRIPYSVHALPAGYWPCDLFSLFIRQCMCFVLRVFVSIRSFRLTSFTYAAFQCSFACFWPFSHFGRENLSFPL